MSIRGSSIDLSALIGAFAGDKTAQANPTYGAKLDPQTGLLFDATTGEQLDEKYQTFRGKPISGYTEPSDVAAIQQQTLKPYIDPSTNTQLWHPEVAKQENDANNSAIQAQAAGQRALALRRGIFDTIQGANPLIGSGPGQTPLSTAFAQTELPPSVLNANTEATAYGKGGAPGTVGRNASAGDILKSGAALAELPKQLDTQSSLNTANQITATNAPNLAVKNVYNTNTQADLSAKELALASRDVVNRTGQEGTREQVENQALLNRKTATENEGQLVGMQKELMPYTKGAMARQAMFQPAATSPFAVTSRVGDNGLLSMNVNRDPGAMNKMQLMEAQLGGGGQTVGAIRPDGSTAPPIPSKSTTMAINPASRPAVAQRQPTLPVTPSGGGDLPVTPTEQHTAAHPSSAPVAVYKGMRVGADGTVYGEDGKPDEWATEQWKDDPGLKAAIQQAVQARDKQLGRPSVGNAIFKLTQ